MESPTFLAPRRGDARPSYRACFHLDLEMAVDPQAFQTSARRRTTSADVQKTVSPWWMAMKSAGILLGP